MTDNDVSILLSWLLIGGLFLSILASAWFEKYDTDK